MSVFYGLVHSQVQGLMDGFSTLETGFKMMSDAKEWINISTEAIQNYVDDAAITFPEKEQVTNSILQQLQDLNTQLSGDPTAEKTKMIQELKDTGVWDEIQAIANNSSMLDDYSVKELSRLSAKLSAIKVIQNGGFNIYDSLQKVIDLIPVQFPLVNTWVATVEESTTVIPSTINIVPIEARYFGVEHISNYIASLFKLYVIKDEIPIDILSDKYIKDVGYYEALDYVQTTEDQASRYKVTGTGRSIFKAWIEPVEISTYRVAAVSETPDFELSMDNGTGEIDQNGVMSFTGSGTLSVIPRSQVPGVLCIEMEDGTVARYPMVVAEEHECNSEEWHIAIAPTETINGLRVKYCDTCGEIIDMSEITSCSNHKFADSTETQAPTLDAAGVSIRTCIHCGCAEYTYEDAYALNGYIYRFDEGTTVEEVLTFFHERGMDVAMEDVQKTDWAATGYTLTYGEEQYQIVIYGDTDGDAEVSLFDLINVRNHVNGEKLLTGAALEASLRDPYEDEPELFDIINIVKIVNANE